MPTFYVDDSFPEHPKALAAGDEACWLFICGLAYARRNNTPTIPKQIAPRLVMKNGPKLAKRLCDANLWHDRGSFYEIHDYEQRNAKQLAKSAQSRRAAHTRWGKVAEQNRSEQPPGTPDVHADSMRTHMRPHSDGSADAMPCYPETHLSSSSSSRHPHRPPPDDSPEEEDELDKLVDNRTITTQAGRLLAERALTNTTSTVTNPEAWLRKTAGQRLEQHAATLDALDLAQFATPAALADRLEPAQKPPPTVDQMQAAAAAIGERNSMPPCARCGTRGGFGWIEVPHPAEDRMTIARCPDCTPRTVVAGAS